jgi:hypothetical protein
MVWIALVKTIENRIRQKVLNIKLKGKCEEKDKAGKNNSGNM